MNSLENLAKFKAQKNTLFNRQSMWFLLDIKEKHHPAAKTADLYNDLGWCWKYGSKQDPALYHLREEKDLGFKVLTLKGWLCYSHYKPNFILQSLYFLNCKMGQFVPTRIFGRIQWCILYVQYFVSYEGSEKYMYYFLKKRNEISYFKSWLPLDDRICCLLLSWLRLRGSQSRRELFCLTSSFLTDRQRKLIWVQKVSAKRVIKRQNYPTHVRFLDVQAKHTETEAVTVTLYLQVLDVSGLVRVTLTPTTNRPSTYYNGPNTTEVDLLLTWRPT